MSDQAATRGFRPAARRRNRIAAGVALGAAAIGGNLLVYSSLDDAESVVQAVRDIPAGSQITADMLRTVDVEVDDSVRTVPGDQLDLVAGRYAKVRIVSGSLVTDVSLQSEPLVTAGRSVVAVRIDDGALPIGLRERSRVQLVLPPGTSSDDPPTVVDGRTVGLPVDTDAALGASSLSIEVAAAEAPTVAAASDVRIVLLEQFADEAVDGVVALAGDTNGDVVDGVGSEN